MQVSGKVLVLKVPVPGGGQVEKDVNAQISKVVAAAEKDAEQVLTKVKNACSTSKPPLDFSGEYAFEVSFMDKKGKPVKPPKGFDPHAANVTLSK